MLTSRPARRPSSRRCSSSLRCARMPGNSRASLTVSARGEQSSMASGYGHALLIRAAGDRPTTRARGASRRRPAAAVVPAWAHAAARGLRRCVVKHPIRQHGRRQQANRHGNPGRPADRAAPAHVPIVTPLVTPARANAGPRQREAHASASSWSVSAVRWALSSRPRVPVRHSTITMTMRYAHLAPGVGRT